MPSPRLDGLDAPRWIASAHIVIFHYYQSTGVTYFEFGGLWTQFFFILGGFILSYSEISKPQGGSAPTVVQYLQKRLVTIYPLHFATLLMCVLDRSERSLFEWCCLPLNALLLQSVVPICYENTCAAYMYNGVSWFLSCLLIYWMCVRPLSRLFQATSLCTCMICLSGCWLCSLLPLAVYPDEHSGGSDYMRLVLSNLVQATPVAYFHVFLSGVVASRIFILLCLADKETGQPPSEGTKDLVLATERAPLVLRYGCTLGYLLWAGLVLSWSFLETGISHGLHHGKVYWMFHNGGLIPILVLILLGCGLGEDPLVKYLFRTNVFRILGRISYSQYLLQDPVSSFLAFYLIPDRHGPWGHNPIPEKFLIVYPFVLLPSAYFIENYFVQPYVLWLRHQLKEPSSNCSNCGLGCRRWCSALFEVFPHRRKKDPESVLGVDPQRLAAIAESAEDSEKEAINAIEPQYHKRVVVVPDYERMQMEEEEVSASQSCGSQSNDEESGSGSGESTVAGERHFPTRWLASMTFSNLTNS